MAAQAKERCGTLASSIKTGAEALERCVSPHTHKNEASTLIPCKSGTCNADTSYNADYAITSHAIAAPTLEERCVREH